MISSVLLLIAFVFGLIVNSLYLWVLWFRMRRMMNTTWFFHLILANFFFTLIIPFLAVYAMMKPRWIFGLFMCKFVNSFMSVCMYESVFILTTISLDRYCLVFYPHWYREHMTPRKASLICAALWTFALLFSSPYLAFRNLKYTNNITICYNDYTFSGKLDQRQIKWSFFGFRLLVGLLIPLGIITICYLSIFIKIKSEKMAKSTRPYKIICTAILSFFISWTPYHIWYGMSVEPGKFSETTLGFLQVLTVIFTCINYCLTPILYLFIVESFKNIFRRSLVALIELVLNETYTSANRSLEDRKEQERVSISVKDVKEERS
ncbi:PREDICTED: probable G-protein coupled receptor 33 [Nanorana parkeri]|uniref:probable G-protein coupled receptor 33 n=1 Tax=Nanorana parkeri TaxID=125878 RepID=UPI0008548F07|nr:PREDICTED: probable G-protein coupled receptor 33 [Nanorana parkeri]